MSTLAAIRSEIIEDLEKYGVTQSSALDPELIEDKIVSARLADFDKFITKGLPLEGFYQLVNNLTFECKKDTRTVGKIVFTDQTTYYSADLPELINTIGWKNIKYFGVHGYDKNLSRLDLADFVARKGARYTSDEPIYTVVGNTAIAKNLEEGFTFALMLAILADPRTAPDWDIETSEFPTPSEQAVKIMVKNSIIQTPGVPDLINDSQRALSQQSEKPQKGQQEE